MSNSSQHAYIITVIHFGMRPCFQNGFTCKNPTRSDLRGAFGKFEDLNFEIYYVEFEIDNVEFEMD